MYAPKPFKEDYLPEQDGHRVYYAQYGNESGPTIVSFHGGPGSHCKPRHASLFDLNVYKVVVIDQRGCGKSEPAGSLEHNTTQDLIADVERVREAMGVEQWFVTGGSWGSTLALSYAQTHPESVRGIMISAVFLGDQYSLDWFGGTDGVGALFSDVWKHRQERFDQQGIGSSAVEVYAALQNAEGEAVKEITADILNYEYNLFTANADVSYMHPEDISEEDITYAKIFMHYESNKFFFADDQLFRNVAAIKDVPMVMVHGRHDVLCPYKRAWELQEAHGNSKLVALPQSNHALTADGKVAQKYIFDAFLTKHT